MKFKYVEFIWKFDYIHSSVLRNEISILRLPVSQLVPVHAEGHMQLYDPFVLIHVPLCKQGPYEQLLTTETEVNHKLVNERERMRQIGFYIIIQFNNCLFAKQESVIIAKQEDVIYRQMQYICNELKIFKKNKKDKMN
jgi:hypothetical protein